MHAFPVLLYLRDPKLNENWRNTVTGTKQFVEGFWIWKYTQINICYGRYDSIGTTFKNSIYKIFEHINEEKYPKLDVFLKKLAKKLKPLP